MLNYNKYNSKYKGFNIYGKNNDYNKDEYFIDKNENIKNKKEDSDNSNEDYEDSDNSNEDSDNANEVCANVNEKNFKVKMVGYSAKDKIKKNQNKDNYDKDFVDLNNCILDLKSKLEEKDNKMIKLKDYYEKKISDIEKKLSNQEYEYEKKDKIIKEKENKIVSLNDINSSLKTEIDNLKLIISSNEETLEQLAKNKIISRIELRTAKTANEDFMPKYDGEDPLKFYDIIVDINSIKEFIKGWNILKNDRGLKCLEDIDENSIKIGVVGNGNKGKSFILSKISDIELPVGESIKTKGLSIKFPQLENHIQRNITLLDSAGQETPVLNNDKIVNYEKSTEFDNKSNDEIMEIEKELTEKSRDKLLTEFFLQNYIVKYSNLLIIVVGILTFSEQKLINKIKKNYSTLNKKGHLVVIHNLQSYVTIKQVKTYIQDTLLKSGTFNLKEEFKISKERTKYYKANKNNQWSYYHEPKSDPHTIHLIFAREGSEAGNYYNQKAIQHIYDILNTINEKEPLNLVQNIKNLFLNLSNNILETQIKENDIEFQDDKIKLNITDNRELILKKCSINELGVSNFSPNGVDPKYSYAVQDDNLIIVCEMPGEISKGSFKVHADCENGKCVIKIEGNKIKEASSDEKNCKILKTTREFGPFNFPIIIEDYNIDTKGGKLNKQNGLITITYPIINSSSDLTFD